MANIRWGARMDGTCKYKTFHFISESFVCVDRCSSCKITAKVSVSSTHWILDSLCLNLCLNRTTTSQVATTTDTSCTVYNNITATNNHILCNVQSTAQHSWSPPTETNTSPPHFPQQCGKQTNPIPLRGVRLTPHHSGERFPSPTTGEDSMQCKANDQP